MPRTDLTGEIDHSFRDSVATFRRMSLAESRATRPLRLKIVTVANGETVEQLASRMAVSDHKVERFRILNGLDANERLRAGDQVKLVVE